MTIHENKNDIKYSYKDYIYRSRFPTQTWRDADYFLSAPQLAHVNQERYEIVWFLVI